jgi:hypothetical protein
MVRRALRLTVTVVLSVTVVHADGSMDRHALRSSLSG